MTSLVGSESYYHEDNELDVIYRRSLDEATTSAPQHVLLSEATAGTNPEMLLLHVSVPLLLLTMTPLLVVVYISYRMELSLERPIVVGSIRTFVQLSILGMILQPIFVRGETCSWLVLAYTMLMVTLAAYESMNRSKYKFPGMFLAVLAALGFNVGWVSLFSFGVILRPTPLWDPQYLIPIVGMLLGNCINGIALSLNNMLTALVEQAREVELFLSFGATPQEATIRLMRESVRVGAMPQLNSMAIIGIISIPGMMTGQILGGAPVTEAARYQMLIMYLIAMTVFGTILAEVNIALRAAFDSSYRLRTDFFVDSKAAKKEGFTRSWTSFCRVCWCCFGCCFEGAKGKKDDGNSLLVPAANGIDTETTGLLASDNSNNKPDVSGSETNQIEFHKVRSAPDEPQSTKISLLQISNLSHSFVVPEDEDEEVIDDKVKGQPANDTNPRRRVLFQGLNLELKAGEMTLIAGPSGCGKSTLLRLVAGLEPTAGPDSGSISLQVHDDVKKSGQSVFDSQLDRTQWRNCVRYVTQFKVDLPGTPRAFIQRINSLQISNSSTHNVNDMIQEVRRLVKAWGMDPGAALESEWSLLSGGEAQRVIVAIALASRPKVLLLDESTSALDLSSKLNVEHSVNEYCEKHKTCVLWITHDPEQMERLSKRG
ncbi:import ATP-binding protein [Seminavis robusta]|uniref:Import ATP-binding protein n=1 Tax=Seminavis robusta TaxID=568900 RepID=A0A9N8H9M5_9STRA|nr:import ATP-binding protein [Seminavis robusta]|eukprot:Sro282_g107540.1 import ATP-binding protein (655) ;mRNA; r:55340-57390